MREARYFAGLDPFTRYTTAVVNDLARAISPDDAQRRAVFHKPSV